MPTRGGGGQEGGKLANAGFVRGAKERSTMDGSATRARSSQGSGSANPQARRSSGLSTGENPVSGLVATATSLGA